jgi:membrane associated rhomboid family serine protease
MIPIRDDAPRYSTPYVNYFLVALNTLVFLFEVMLPPVSREGFIRLFGVTPYKITGLISGVPQITPSMALVPILTSMFLHGSWLHLIGNMWFLWIFGDNIEDHLGHFKYLVFYLISGVAAALLQTAFDPHSTIPAVGASGAIAGVMGGYFILFPSARVLTLVPFLFVFFLWIPAWIILGYWFVIQFLSGAATSIATTSRSTGGIAFWAHVGGFIAGIAMIKLFPSRPRRFRYDTW